MLAGVVEYSGASGREVGAVEEGVDVIGRVQVRLDGRGAHKITYKSANR